MKGEAGGHKGTINQVNPKELDVSQRRAATEGFPKQGSKIFKLLT